MHFTLLKFLIYFIEHAFKQKILNKFNNCICILQTVLGEIQYQKSMFLFHKT